LKVKLTFAGMGVIVGGVEIIVFVFGLKTPKKLFLFFWCFQIKNAENVLQQKRNLKTCN
jgi:hypothetical protein